MDQSLDAIIATRPKNGRRGSGVRRSTPKAAVLGSVGGTNPATRARQATAAAAIQAKAAPSVNDKIIVSNLPLDVNEQQVKELFHTTVGPLRSVTLQYDAAGKSRGVASVTFAKKGDGDKAYQQYNNRLIDGKRPMRVEIVVDPSAKPAASLVARVAPAAAPAAATSTAPRTGGRPRRGRGGKVAGTRKPEKPKTAADLDAEMEDYTASNTATA